MSKYLLFLAIVLIGCRERDPRQKLIANIRATSVSFDWGSNTYLFNYCKAFIDGNYLKLYIRQIPDSLFQYDINIFKRGKDFEVAVIQPWSVTDSSYVPARFKIVKQDIRLNQPMFRAKDHLKGELNLLVLAHQAYSRNRGEMILRENWDTVRVHGVVEAIVQ